MKRRRKNDEVLMSAKFLRRWGFLSQMLVEIASTFFFFLSCFCYLQSDGKLFWTLKLIKWIMLWHPNKHLSEPAKQMKVMFNSIMKRSSILILTISTYWNFKIYTILFYYFPLSYFMWYNYNLESNKFFFNNNLFICLLNILNY